MPNFYFPSEVPGNRTKTCFRISPPMINSKGLLENPKSPAKFLTYSLPLLELQIAVILTLTHTLYALLKRFGITAFVSQVLAGLILGPTFLGRFDFMREVVFPHDSQELICTAAYFGYIVYMFISAAKIDIGPTLRSTGKVVIITGAVSLIAPLIFGVALIRPHVKELLEKDTVSEAMQVVFMNSFSTFSIIVHVLDELKLANSELGQLALSASLVADGLGVVFHGLLTEFQQKLSLRKQAVDVSAMVVLMIVLVLIVRPLLWYIIQNTPEGSAIDSSVAYILIICALGTAVFYHVFHQLPCVGAFVFGLTIPAGPPLGSALVDKFEGFIYAVFVPVAVVTSVMRADLTLIMIRSDTIQLYLAIIILIFGAKLVACILPSLYWQIPFIDSLIFAVIMTCRGNIELALYVLARDTLMISEELFALLVLYMFINSTFVAVTVKHLYDPARKYAGYQARDIMHMKPKSELRILACVYKLDNIPSVIGLFDAFHPTKERFVSLYVLHLIQLVGQNTPMLVSHQKQKPVTDSRSHNVVVSFCQYEQRNWDCVSISTFTALSPSKSMNEDISALALDRLTSLILLPLHRKWSIHGSIAAEDNYIRTTNCTVLEKAPCSVGIFFDRGKLGRGASITSPKTSHSVCTIFLGGKDDREVLSLAKWIAKNSNTCLTVVSLLPEYCEKNNHEDVMLDTSALEEIQKIAGKGSSSNIVYKEQTVKDGPDTAFTIRSMADDYDLFLVGRRYGIKCPQTAGLSEWTELPELGIVGDLFASKYLSTRAAVLVVQQQKQMK